MYETGEWNVRTVPSLLLQRQNNLQVGILVTEPRIFCIVIFAAYKRTYIISPVGNGKGAESSRRTGSTIDYSNGAAGKKLKTYAPMYRYL